MCAREWVTNRADHGVDGWTPTPCTCEQTVTSVVTGKPVNMAGRVDAEATGRGFRLFATTRSRHLGMPVKGCRVIVQGFGNVGSNTAKLHV